MNITIRIECSTNRYARDCRSEMRGSPGAVRHNGGKTVIGTVEARDWTDTRDVEQWLNDCRAVVSYEVQS